MSSTWRNEKDKLLVEIASLKSNIVWRDEHLKHVDAKLREEFVRTINGIITYGELVPILDTIFDDIHRKNVEIENLKRQNDDLAKQVAELKDDAGIECKYHRMPLTWCSDCVEIVYAQGWRKEVIFWKASSQFQAEMLRYLDKQIALKEETITEVNVEYDLWNNVKREADLCMSWIGKFLRHADESKAEKMMDYDR